MRGFYLAERQELLETYNWLPGDDQKPYFIECPYSSGTAFGPEDYIRHGFLEHEEVKAWLEKPVSTPEQCDDRITLFDTYSKRLIRPRTTNLGYLRLPTSLLPMREEFGYL